MESTDYSKRVIDLPNARIVYIDNFLSVEESQELFDYLITNIEWKQPVITLFGKQQLSPRVAAWIGDANARYTYSGLTNDPQPWCKALQDMRERVNAHINQNFNSVLLNLYRDGNDSMGWHSDNEPELGRNPIIASLSVGATRRFLLKHKRDTTQPTLKIDLNQGSLLIMERDTQHHWRHAVPKTKKPVDARINLTFRNVICQ